MQLPHDRRILFLALLGVKVDPLLLLLCIAAMVIGGIVGVPVAARAPIRLVHGLVGLALLIAAFFYSLSNLGLMPSGWSATSLRFQWTPRKTFGGTTSRLFRQVIQEWKSFWRRGCNERQPVPVRTGAPGIAR